MPESKVFESSTNVPRGTLDRLGLIPVEDAAQMLGIEAKRLRGFMWRNKVGDPIGDATLVYGWSCVTLAKRLAAVNTAVMSTVTT